MVKSSDFYSVKVMGYIFFIYKITKLGSWGTKSIWNLVPTTCWTVIWKFVEYFKNVSFTGLFLTRIFDTNQRVMKGMKSYLVAGGSYEVASKCWVWAAFWGLIIVRTYIKNHHRSIFHPKSLKLGTLYISHFWVGKLFEDVGHHVCK